MHPGRPELPTLTGLLFFAAFFVMLAHAAVQSGTIPKVIDTELLTNYANTGMALFFTLSGFVMQYNYGYELAASGSLDKAALRRFAVSRFARIYPLYIVFMLFMILWQHLITEMGRGPVIAVLLHVFSLQSAFFLMYPGARMFPFFSVTWSIGTEMVFYVLFPFLTLLVTRRLASVKTVSIAIGALITLCLLYIHALIAFTSIHAVHGLLTWGSYHDAINDTTFTGWLVTYSPYGRVLEFIMGMLTAQLFLLVRHMPPSAREQQWGRVLTWGALMLHLFMLFAIFHHTHYFIWSPQQTPFVLSPTLALLMFATCRYHTRISVFLRHGLLLKLGEASYSIYLLHIPVIWGLSGHFARFGESVPYYFLRMITLMAITLVLALISYRWFENPARVWVRKTLATQRFGSPPRK